ncbi:MAG: caspase domain-containing protein [Terriglobales bacterium]
MVRVAVAVITIFVLSAYAQTDSQEPYQVPNAVPRVALVVGAENYENYDHVPNARNDALEAEKTLTNIGFKVNFLPDPKDDNSIIDHVKDLAGQAGELRSPVIVVFYFAGHGFQNGAFPSIVPVGARKDHLLDDSVPVSTLVDMLATHTAGLSLFFLDSCRTGLHGASQAEPQIDSTHFSAMDVHNVAVLDLATELGAPAGSSMPSNYHSLYTYSLTNNLTKRKSLSEALEDVRSYVGEYSDPKQWSVIVHNANIYRFYLVPGQERIDAEQSIWRETLKTNRVECIDRYIHKYPGSAYLGSALSWKADRPASIPSPEGGSQCPEELE